MKKKLLAAILCLLMIGAMTSGVFAHTVIPGGNVVVPNPDGSASVLSDRWMYDTCPNPECTNAYALFYVAGNEVRYYCNVCKASGVAYRAGYACKCLSDCKCTVTCPSCGKTATCGTQCSCNAWVACPSTCTTCTAPSVPSWPTTPPTWWNGWYWDGTYPEYWWDTDWWWSNPATGSYRVYISTNMSAAGSYSITGGEFGKYNDTKTVTITTNYGYALRDVTVNGVSYGALSQFDLQMTRNYAVQLTFVKLNLTQQYGFTASSTGNGTVTLVKNGTMIANPSAINAVYSDTLTYRFIPNGDNYYVKDVKVNGKSIGARNIYSVSNIQSGAAIDVTFAWKNPYTDVSSSHLAAVEFVTEAGIMSSANKYINTDLFKGSNRVSIKSFVCALAELADTEEMLDNNTDRTQWALDFGLISEDEDVTEIVSVRKACDIMYQYLLVLEKENSVTFTGHKDGDTAKTLCVNLDLVSEAAYEKDAGITRYNVAELCYAIANLNYK